MRNQFAYLGEAAEKLDIILEENTKLDYGLFGLKWKQLQVTYFKEQTNIPNSLTTKLGMSFITCVF